MRMNFIVMGCFSLCHDAASLVYVKESWKEADEDVCLDGRKEYKLAYIVLRTLNKISTASNRVIPPSDIHQHQSRAEFSTSPQAQVNPSGLNFPVVWSYEKLGIINECSSRSLCRCIEGAVHGRRLTDFRTLVYKLVASLSTIATKRCLL
jgi:hypothetical protein